MDGFFGIGLPELFMIAVIALIVLGPERLPGTIREVAKFIKQVRAIGGELMSQFGDEFKDFQDLDPRRILNEMTDPTKPDEKSKTPAAKPATNTVAKSTSTTPKPTTTTTTSATAKSIAAAAAVSNPSNANKSDNQSTENKSTENRLDVSDSSDSAEKPVIAPPKATSTLETASATTDSVTAASTQTLSAPPSLTVGQNGSSSTTAASEIKPSTMVESKSEEKTFNTADQSGTPESKPKRTRKPKAKAEKAEPVLDQSEGGGSHESAN